MTSPIQPNKSPSHSPDPAATETPQRTSVIQHTSEVATAIFQSQLATTIRQLEALLASPAITPGLQSTPREILVSQVQSLYQLTGNVSVIAHSIIQQNLPLASHPLSQQQYQAIYSQCEASGYGEASTSSQPRPVQEPPKQSEETTMPLKKRKLKLKELEETEALEAKRSLKREEYLKQKLFELLQQNPPFNQGLFLLPPTTRYANIPFKRLNKDPLFQLSYLLLYTPKEALVASLIKHDLVVKVLTRSSPLSSFDLALISRDCNLQKYISIPGKHSPVNQIPFYQALLKTATKGITSAKAQAVRLAWRSTVYHPELTKNPSIPVLLKTGDLVTFNPDVLAQTLNNVEKIYCYPGNESKYVKRPGSIGSTNCLVKMTSATLQALLLNPQTQHVFPIVNGKKVCPSSLLETIFSLILFSNTSCKVRVLPCLVSHDPNETIHLSDDDAKQLEEEFDIFLKQALHRTRKTAAKGKTSS